MARRRRSAQIAAENSALSNCHNPDTTLDDAPHVNVCRAAVTCRLLRSAMFSPRLERRRQFNRLAVLVAATLLAVGIALIGVWAVQAFDMLRAAEAGRAPIIIGVLIALAVLVVLCLIAYAAVRAVGRFTSR